MLRRDFLKTMTLGTIVPFMSRLWHGGEERVDETPNPSTCKHESWFRARSPRAWTTAERFVTPCSGHFLICGEAWLPGGNTKAARLRVGGTSVGYAQAPPDTSRLVLSSSVYKRVDEPVEFLIYHDSGEKLLSYSRLEVSQLP